MAVTLIVFIDDIDTLHKRLYQRYQHIRLCVFCVFTEGQQPSLIRLIPVHSENS